LPSLSPLLRGVSVVVVVNDRVFSQTLPHLVDLCVQIDATALHLLLRLQHLVVWPQHLLLLLLLNTQKLLLLS
jgi:hypothetical protein